MNKNTDLAEAQLLGFFHAKKGFSLKDLVNSMGLTKEEWESIKLNYPITSYMTEDDKHSIDLYTSDK